MQLEDVVAERHVFIEPDCPSCGARMRPHELRTGDLVLVCRACRVTSI